MAAETLYANATLGDDTTGDGSIGNPFASIYKCGITFNVGADATIIVADGTYLTSAATTSQDYLYISKSLASLTITPENDDQVTCIATGTGARVCHILTTVGDLTIGKIIFDAQSLQAGCITAGTTPSFPSVTFNGTKFRNGTGALINITNVTDFVMDSDWEMTYSAETNAGAIINTTATTPSFLMHAGTITCSAAAHLTDSVIRTNATGTGTTCSIYDIDANMIVGASSNAASRLIRANGYASMSIHDITCTIDSNAKDDAGPGIDVENSATACTSCHIYNINLLGGDASHRYKYGIKVGDEGTSANDNSITGVHVFNSNIYGSNHSYMAGFVTGARFYDLYVKDYTIGALGKGTNSCYFTGILLEEPGSGTVYTLYAKADTGSFFCNNTVISKAGSATGAYMYAGFNLTSGVDDSSGTNFINNIISVDTAALFTKTDTLSTANFTTNCFYSSIAQTNEYSYQGTTYDTVTLFNAIGTATGNIDSDPLFIDYSGSDYTLKSSSPCIGTGTRYWGTDPNPIGYGGQPFSDIGTDIGAYQSSNNAFHPVNL